MNHEGFLKYKKIDIDTDKCKLYRYNGKQWDDFDIKKDKIWCGCGRIMGFYKNDYMEDVFVLCENCDAFYIQKDKTKE